MTAPDDLVITIPTLAWVLPLYVVLIFGWWRWFLPWFDRNVNDRLIERLRRKRGQL